MKKTLAAIAVLFFTTGLVFAEDVFDENSYFDDAETVIPTSNIIDENIVSNRDKESVSFSGSVTARSGYSMHRDWFTGDTNWDKNSINNTLYGNFLFEARLRNSFKVFLNGYLSINPNGNLRSTTASYLNTNTFAVSVLTSSETVYTDIALKEFFVDFNLNQALYFRLGKQVLQWGRCFFWNPTDLVNVEKKDFTDLSAYREGGYGLKLTLPFGTLANLYGYVNAANVTNFDQYAVSGKAEILVGGWEAAVSGYAKKGSLPVYGLDLSGRIPFINVNVSAEAGFSYGSDTPVYGISETTVGPVTMTNLTTNYITEQWVPKAVINLSRSFEVFNKADSLTVMVEYYYNHLGYTNNIFELAENLSPIQYLRSINSNQQADLLKYQLIMQAYNPNNYGVHYLAGFISWSEAFVSELSLSLNGIANLTDGSALLALGFTWAPVYNFTLGGNIYGYLGEIDREFTFAGTAMTAELSASYSF